MRGSFGQRISPVNPGESGKVGVGAADDEAMPDRYCCQVGIRNEIRRRERPRKNLAEKVRVISGRLRNPHSGLRQPFCNLSPGLLDAQWLSEESRVGRKTQKCERGLPWNPHFARSAQFGLEPDSRFQMLREVGELGVEKEIRVDQNHR